jgi:hypothetical protein
MWAGNMVELMVTKNVEKCHESQQKNRPPPYPKNFVQNFTEFPGNSVSYSTHLVSVKTTVCLVLFSIFEVCVIQSSFSNYTVIPVRLIQILKLDVRKRARHQPSFKVF